MTKIITPMRETVYDRVAGGIVTIDMMHRQVHLGQLFEAYVYNEALNNNSSLTTLVSTTDKSVHMRFQASATGESKIILRKDVVVDSLGTEVFAVNKNLGSNNPSPCRIYTGATFTSSTIISEDIIVGGRGGQAVGSNLEGFADEWVLVPGNDYLFTLTNESGQTRKAVVHLSFYGD